MTVALGLTTERAWNNLIVLRWIDLLRSHAWTGPLFYARGAPGFAAARNIVVKQAWERYDEWNSLLFWDSDQLPPHYFPWPGGGWDRRLPGWETRAPSGAEHFLAYLDRLVAENPEKEVFAGLYFSRDTGMGDEQPFEPLAYHIVPAHDEEPIGFRRLSPGELHPMLRARGLYRVGGAGTGSMLIRKSVLERLAERKGLLPWLRDPQRKPAPLFEQQQLRTGGQRGLQWTEDLFFCYEISQIEPPVTIWLDTVMESGHQTDVWTSSEHYLATRGMLAQGSAGMVRDRKARLARQVDQIGRGSKIWTPGG